VEESLEHSLIIPFYKSASYLAGTLERAFAWGEGTGESFEVLAVDDGSPDSTWEALLEFRKKFPDLPLSLLKHEKNQGKGMAVRTGVRAARGKFVYFTDADLTYPLESLDALAAALKDGADMAIGCRTHPESRYLVSPAFFPILFRRHLSGRIFNLLVRLLVVPGIHDTQAGIKGFRKASAKRIFAMGRLNRFSFDVELLFLARKWGLDVREVPVLFIYGKEPSTVRFFQDSLRMIRDMLLIRWWDLTGRYREDPPGGIPGPGASPGRTDG